jgi:hypothetical protein
MTAKQSRGKSPNAPTFLSRDQILGAEDINIRYLEVPEWGGTVRIKELTGSDRDALEASFIERNHDGSYARNTVNIRAKYAAISIVDENGEQMFSFGDIEMLGRKSATALDRVFEAVTEASGMTKQELERIEGNSDSAG